MFMCVSDLPLWQAVVVYDVAPVVGCAIGFGLAVLIFKGLEKLGLVPR